MIKICEKSSDDGTRRAEIWDDQGKIRLLFFENNKLVHSADPASSLQGAENLAESFCLKDSTPDLLFG